MLIGALIAAACNVHLPTKVPACSLPRYLEVPKQAGGGGVCRNPWLGNSPQTESNWNQISRTPKPSYHTCLPRHSSLPTTWTFVNCGTSLRPHRRHHSLVAGRLHLISNSWLLIPTLRANSIPPLPRGTRRAAPGERYTLENPSLTRASGPERLPISRESNQRLYRLPAVITCERRAAHFWTCR